MGVFMVIKNPEIKDVEKTFDVFFHNDKETADFFHKIMCQEFGDIFVLQKENGGYIVSCK